MSAEFSKVERATTAIESYANKVRSKVEVAVGKKFVKYNAVEFRAYSVHGDAFYLIKVDTGSFYHIKVKVTESAGKEKTVKLLSFQADVPKGVPLHPTYVAWPHGPITP